MTQTARTLRASLPFLPVAAGLFCIQLDFFSLGLALPTIATELGSTVTNLSSSPRSAWPPAARLAGVVTLVSQWPSRRARTAASSGRAAPA